MWARVVGEQGEKTYRIEGTTTTTTTTGGVISALRPQNLRTADGIIGGGAVARTLLATVVATNPLGGTGAGRSGGTNTGRPLEIIPKGTVVAEMRSEMLRIITIQPPMKIC